ncbi:class I SAM-dependent methyltransferase [Nitrospira moscoviensis]|nr:class I SAM-dependent methyltransferase [Nitrospira moscoviensis]
MDRFYRALTTPLYDRWLGGVHAGLVIKGLYLQWMVARFLREGRRRVLDAGCGPEAQMAALLAGRYPTSSFVGWDLHLAPQAHARRPNLSVVEADLKTLGEVETYDLVYSIDVLEHMDDVEGALDRLARSLRPGGLLFIHVPDPEARSWWTCAEGEVPNCFRPHRTGDDHVHEGFSVPQLVQALRRRSLEVLDARPTFGRVVGLIKDLFSLGERRGIKGIGLMLLPAVLLGVAGEIVFPPKRGNGSMILGRKSGGFAA